jgi:hypothetical protein
MVGTRPRLREVKVFISWSKQPSKQIARALHTWMPDMFHEVEPFFSEIDIDRGKRWSAEIAAQLDACSEGVVVITPENVREPWLNFEAGAIAKHVGDSHVWTVLYKMSKRDLTSPLGDLQATLVEDEEEMFDLVKSINSACERPRTAEQLRRQFDRLWPEFLESLQGLPATPFVPDVPVVREESDVLGEVLERIREMERRLPIDFSKPPPPAVSLPPLQEAVSAAVRAFPDGTTGWSSGSTATTETTLQWNLEADSPEEMLDFLNRLTEHYNGPDATLNIQFPIQSRIQRMLVRVGRRKFQVLRTEGVNFTEM